MSAVLSPVAKQQFFDNNGRPLVGGKLFTYEAGTTTKVDTYTDSTGLALNTNPIILNYRGECNLWVTPNTGYKFVLAPANDTDPPTNPIWTVDQIFDSQLLTLYAGVDTGSPNAYVLTFDASFTSYTDGIIIYWTPSNTNTGASTLNVNGLGAVPIVNQDGTALYRAEIRANEIATVLYSGGNFVLISTIGTIAFNVRRSSSTQLMPASTVTDCIFNALSLGQKASPSLTTGIFTAPNYGIYHFDATITLVPGGTNCVLNGIYFSKNNATAAGADRFDIGIGLRGAQYSNTGNSMLFAGSCTVEMEAGDTMRMKWDAGTSGAGTNEMGLGSAFAGVQVA